jgi:hypothetical protein
MNDKFNPFPRWVWVIYGLLFAGSIPWYLPEETGMSLVFGLPLWLLFSIGAILLTAAFTAWIIARFWQNETPSD